MKSLWQICSEIESDNVGKVPGTRQAFNKRRLLSHLLTLSSNFLLTCPSPRWVVRPRGERLWIIYENKVGSQKMLPLGAWVNRGMGGWKDGGRQGGWGGERGEGKGGEVNGRGGNFPTEY